MVTATRERLERPFALRGNNRAIFLALDPEILIEGMAGTGKTRTVLELINALAHRYPNLRALIVRKIAVTLSTSCLVTLEKKVLDPNEGVRFFGGSAHEAASYRYPNGSRIVVGGMDSPEKVLSSEYDLIYYNEVTDGSIEDWETLLGRLRGHVLPNPRIIGDCNPTYGSHWVNKRAESGMMRRIVTRIEDNPEYFNDDGTMTEAGAMYLSRLDRMTGQRYQRYRLGLWAGVENAVYPHFDRSIHVRDIPEALRFTDGAFGGDFGRVHKSAAVACSRDQYGRIWVREAWGRPSDDHGDALRRVVAELRQRYALRRGRVDPNQDVLAGLVGANIARSGEGSRQHRIDITGRLLNTFPGGIVPDLKGETKGRAMSYGPNAVDDTPGLLFVKGAPGIDDLCAELEAYHYEHKQTDTRDEMVVARINDDLVAAMEYAIEELEEYQPTDYSAAFANRPMSVASRGIRGAV